MTATGSPATDSPTFPPRPGGARGAPDRPPAGRILFLALACLALGGGAALGTDCYEEIDPYYWGFDVPSMIHVRTPGDAASVRASMISYLWGGAGYPASKIPTVQHLPCDGDPPPARGPYPSDFPKSLSGLMLWLDAADPVTINAISGRVYQWQDKSGRGNDASQSFGTVQPLYVTSGIHGKPAISFDGIDDFLDIGDASTLDVSNLTLFVVVQFADPNNDPSPVVLAKRPLNSAYQFVLDTDKTPLSLVNIQGQPFSTRDQGGVSGDAEIWSASHDGRTLRMYRNEWPSESSPVALGAIQGSSGTLRIGEGEVGSSTAFSGMISEIILYNRALSDADRRQVEDYLGWKYGIYQAWPGWIGRIGSSNIGCVDRLDAGMDYGLHSYSYLMFPKTPVNRLLIFHQGHDDFLLSAGGQQLMKHFLDSGFAVMAFWMPLFGENPKTLPDVQGSALTLGNHDQMPIYLEDSRGSFIRFFLEPVAAALNYLTKSYSFDDINMAGVSGGGWATHLMSALDTRIGLSFPTAGSLPLYLRDGPCPNGSEGDTEQVWGPLYQQRASWPDIYILGGYGPDRQQVHVLNQYDSCCFYGVNYRTYEPTVANAVSNFGAGAYGVFLDSTHQEHKISDPVITGVIDPAISAQTLPYRPETNLTLSQSDTPDPVWRGDSLTYTLNVINNGPSRAGNVTLTDTLPPGATLVSATPSQGSCTAAAPVTCLLGDLAEGGSATVVLVVSPGAAGLLTNSALVSYDLPDFMPADNASTETTQVNILDQDQDGVEDRADCAPLDATVFAPPPEVTGVRLDPDGRTIEWNSAIPESGSGMSYDLMRGSLSDLGSGPGGLGACLARDIVATQKSDATVPRPGEGFWYLVRGENACGQGPVGTTGSGAPRRTCDCELSRTLSPTLK